ncbi:hypothetical protein ACG3SL_13180 [Sphingomonas sp. CJ20]
MRDLTEFARQGYDAGDDQAPLFAHGSSAFLAWRVGRWLRSNGGIRPSSVTAEPGYSVRVDGVKVDVPAGATAEPRISAEQTD